jgi:hypothetical protein
MIRCLYALNQNVIHINLIPSYFVTPRFLQKGVNENFDFHMIL